MKKVAILVLVVFVFSILLAVFIIAEQEDDLQAIKKAVKKKPNYEKGKEVKWFKVLITDNRTKKDKVKITLPISLLEVILKSSQNKSWNFHGDDCDIDFKELFAELKKLGPMVFIEVQEEDETIKIWLE
ncbi:MAG: hypothetical protein GQ536_00855 [Candidatus Aminicenantes bacterium]|nr:hypothetical protein [Candidatus Aminicenantes bacterium]